MTLREATIQKRAQAGQDNTITFGRQAAPGAVATKKSTDYTSLVPLIKGVGLGAAALYGTKWTAQQIRDSIAAVRGWKGAASTAAPAPAPVSPSASTSAAPAGGAPAPAPAAALSPEEQLLQAAKDAEARQKTLKAAEEIAAKSGKRIIGGQLVDATALNHPLVRRAVEVGKGVAEIPKGVVRDVKAGNYGKAAGKAGAIAAALAATGYGASQLFGRAPAAPQPKATAGAPVKSRTPGEIE